MHIRLVAFVAVALTIAAPAFSSQVTRSVRIIPPGHEAWKAGTGRDRGAQLAMLMGRATSSGMYTFRVKMPAGFVFSPHVHNADETATILSGTVLLGLGNKIRTDRTHRLSAGAFVEIPAGVVHYWIARTPAVLQASGIGPRTTVAR